MPSGTGLDRFASRFPDRCFDVGIAEQHAVTFAAGMATEGLRPFCAIYSTFLQRAYDQVVHDVAIQQLPVRFAIDRAGLVGADGATHAGSFDLAYLGCLPGMTIMAPSDELELMHMVATAGHDRRRAERGALSARRGHRDRRCRSAARRCRSGAGRIMREGVVGRDPVARHPAGRQHAGRRRAGRARLLHHGGRRPLRQAVRHRAGRAAGPPSRRADHRRGGLDRRLRLRRHAASRRRAGCWMAGSRSAR